MSYEVHHGDCLEVMKSLPDNSVDAVVTDPPYGLSFMGKRWDYDVPSVEIWQEVLRVLKPGGHLLSFGGTRTYHRMVVNIEDAGFEIRDQIQWIYGSGFPKSLDVSKAMDKQAGAEREVTGQDPIRVGRLVNQMNGSNPTGTWQAGKRCVDITTPATESAKQWEGWGTALKPANEPICLARKPLIGTVAENVKTHGTGAINIDGCRVASVEAVQSSASKGDPFGAGAYPIGEGRLYQSNGRFPANVIHDGSEEVVGLFPQASKQCGTPKKTTHDAGMFGIGTPGTIYRDATDSAARFFYCAKASKADRNAGLEGFEVKQATGGGGYIEPSPLGRFPANVIHDGSEEVVGLFPQTTSGALKPYKENHINASSFQFEREKTFTQEANSGSAARFFYCPKASKADRNAGLEGFEEKERPTLNNYVSPSEGRTAPKNGSPQRNHHPTVKPTELMRYLCRLITPPNGTVLDPFAGSGSTGKAAILEGFSFIGIEREKEYAEIARARIAHVSGGLFV